MVLEQTSICVENVLLAIWLTNNILWEKKNSHTVYSNVLSNDHWMLALQVLPRKQPIRCELVFVNEGHSGNFGRRRAINTKDFRGRQDPNRGR